MGVSASAFSIYTYTSLDGNLCVVCQVVCNKGKRNNEYKKAPCIRYIGLEYGGESGIRTLGGR